MTYSTSVASDRETKLDYHAHLPLPEGNHLPGVFKARCSAVLPTVVTQLPPGLTCERRHLIFGADLDAPVGVSRQDG